MLQCSTYNSSAPALEYTIVWCIIISFHDSLFKQKLTQYHVMCGKSLPVVIYLDGFKKITTSRMECFML